MKSLLAGALALAFSPTVPIGSVEVLSPSAASASGWFNAHQVPLPPAYLQGEGMATPVAFLDQPAIDASCGGKDQVVACAVVGGGWMALPNPCQARFRGESYAAVACHELGHINGWSHG